jgi:hypothetical protein
MLLARNALASVVLGGRQRGESCVPFDASLQGQAAMQQRRRGFGINAPDGICDQLLDRHVSDPFFNVRKKTQFSVRRSANCGEFNVKVLKKSLILKV